MTSPALIPAFAADEFGITWLTNAPRWASTFIAFANSEFSSVPMIPSSPRFTWPYSTICDVRFFTMLLGIAKPIPMLPPSGARIAVLIPISSPFRFTSAPPELPRLIAASV
ncbi:Uncharacterised protein [Salmonella enterica subsp. enterica serovar Bovismorbificans]|uniref:Uncharacterized protein n=1 Tax=Salmonella enterica subsp. enterica serovar Bovismorbificans TaxID=58097 RepID=A0A655DG07_SALET|nr:Uncharacterised protein [Salmonella enterica subsp. enterica serovar Bovismorbificans]